MNKKILLIGPDFFSINNSIYNSLVKLGHSVRLKSHSDVYPKGVLAFLVFGVPKYFKILFPTIIYDYFLNREIYKIYLEFKPDIVLVIKGEKVFKTTLQRLTSKKIIWLMDGIERVNIPDKKLASFDKIFFMEECDYFKYSESFPLSYFSPNCFDHNIYYPTDNKKLYDVVFVGSLYKNRISLFKKIVDECPELKIKIIGYFPSKFDYLFNFDLIARLNYRNVFKISKLSPKITNEIYNKSKIVINPHFDSFASGTNMRFFEIIGSSSIQLTNSKMYISKNYYELIPTFSNENQIPILIRTILENIDFFQFKANLAHDLALEKDTFDVRLNGMV